MPLKMRTERLRPERGYVTCFNEHIKFSSANLILAFQRGPQAEMLPPQDSSGAGGGI